MPTEPGLPRKGGSRSRRKGTRAERELVTLLRNAGIAAERVPLSGAVGGRFAGDVLLADGRRAEVKIRRTGLSLLYRLIGDNLRPVTVDPTARGASQVNKWLDTADVLFARTDRMPWLVVERSLGLLRVQTLSTWLREIRSFEEEESA